MALIICQECGREISDKSKACVHCGCPIEFSTKSIKVVDKVENKINNQQSMVDNEYSLEILSCGESKMKMAELLSSELKLKFREVMDNLNTLPCYFYENVDERIVNVLNEEINDLKVRYKLHESKNIIKGIYLKKEEVILKPALIKSEVKDYKVVYDKLLKDDDVLNEEKFNNLLKNLLIYGPIFLVVLLIYFSL